MTFGKLQCLLVSDSIGLCPLSWFHHPLKNTVTRTVTTGTTKPLNNKFTQTHTDQETDLDLNVKLGFDNASLRFLSARWPPAFWKRTFLCISLGSLLAVSPAELPMLSFDRPFGNCLSCLGCFDVPPICLDYRHTEWTGCSSAWLYVANTDWHQPAPGATSSV